MPGHKRRLADDELLKEIYRIDITETDGFDDLHNATGILRQSEEAAAVLFSSDETHFLVNGSTCGIEAAITGTLTAGDTAVVASNCHRSVFNAIMLSGAKMIMITPEKEKHFDTYGGIEKESVQKALDMAALPDSGMRHRTAVIITSPTYEGITSDIESIAKVCHENGAVLIVDSAHGAHFGFSDSFPKSAVTSGADVTVTSVHKTLPAMTQTALIHINERCPSKERIRTMLPVFMTSSPSYVLMASIDSMTHLIAGQKTELFEKYLKRLDGLYDRAKEFKRLDVLCKDKLTAKGSADHDKGKIVIRDAKGCCTGRRLYDRLYEKGLVAEMATAFHVILMTSVADTDEGFEVLGDALSSIDEELAKEVPEKIKKESGNSGGASVRACDFDMKAALFADSKEYVPLDLAKGRISAEMVTIYPPGIPAVFPGDVIGEEAVTDLIDAIDNGIEVIGLKDKEIAVTWERSST